MAISLSVSVRATGGCGFYSPDSKGYYTATVTNVQAKTAKLVLPLMTMESQLNWLMKSLEFSHYLNQLQVSQVKLEGNLGKGDTTSYSTIKANLGDSPLNVPYKVVGFKMFITKNGQPIKYFKIK